jgi:ubiquinone/menaquinone biosynthesis C-methylase UbiE
MKRIVIPEILDSDACSPEDVAASLQDMGRINRWFGGVATTQALIQRVARATGKKQFSVLEVAAGFGEIPKIVRHRVARRGITLDLTFLDRARSHLPGDARSLVGNALALPVRDGAFDLVSCSLFAHHLSPAELAQFVNESLRVSQCAVLINDLVRHPMHLALVYAGFPFMRSRVSRFDGVASVRKSYVPEEVNEILAAQQRVEIHRHFLYRMGIIVWKA